MTTAINKVALNSMATTLSSKQGMWALLKKPNSQWLTENFFRFLVDSQAANKCVNTKAKYGRTCEKGASSLPRENTKNVFYLCPR